MTLYLPYSNYMEMAKEYGNGQGDQMILLTPSRGQNPVFVERIEADNLGKKCFFLFHFSQFRVRVRVFETCGLHIHIHSDYHCL